MGRFGLFCQPEFVGYTPDMAAWHLPTETRDNPANFSGHGFVFLRHFSTWEGMVYPHEVELHRHEWHEFVWTRRQGRDAGGLNLLSLDGRSRQYPGDSLLHIPPFHPHSFLVTGPQEFWVMGVDHGQMLRLFAHSPIAGALRQMVDSWKSLPVCLLDLPRAFGDFICRPRIWGTVEPLEALALLVEFNDYLGHWQSRTPDPTVLPAQDAPAMPPPGGAVARPNTGEVEFLVQRAMEFFETRYNRRVGLKECAAWLGVGASTLSRQFMRSCGQSIPRYLAGVRIRNAQAMLAETSLPILDVALECGYGEAAWFSRQFSDLVGMSPSQWRTQARRTPGR